MCALRSLMSQVISNTSVMAITDQIEGGYETNHPAQPPT